MYPAHTPWELFLGIIALYVVVSLVIGGKKAYFDPWQEPTPEKAEDK
jgi:hypothetical protein